MKSTMRRILSVLAAAALAIEIAGAGAVPALAATTASGSNGATTGQATADSGKGGSGTITINLPTALSSGSSTTSYNYKVYKIFDATYASNPTGSNPTAYSYNLENNLTDVPVISGTDGQVNKFYKDDSGNVYYGTLHDTSVEGSFAVTINNVTKYIVVKTGEMTSAEAEAANTAIKKYITDNKITAAADVDVANTFSTLKITGLTYGYYYITTSAGSAIALTSTNPDAVIQSKNDVPHIDKTITAVDDGAASGASSKGSVSADGENAIAELNSTVHYQSVIHVKKGAVNYVFRDTMESELSFDTGSVKVYTKVGNGNETEIQPSVTSGGTTTTNYTLTTTASTATGDTYTFKIAFEDTFVSGLAAQLTDDTEVQIIIRYTAKVTGDALQTDSADNSATISYGSNPTHTSEPSVTHVYNARINVTKHVDDDGTAGSALPGAQFVLKNASGKYYKYTAAAAGGGETPAADAAVSWVDSEEDATKFTSDSNGAVVCNNPSLTGFTGLANGTYTLHETVAPAGYNKAEDTTFTIKAVTEEHALEAAGDNANLIQTGDVLDRAGSELPSTGGTGTAIFYVIGGLIVAGAVILLAVRKKKRA